VKMCNCVFAHVRARTLRVRRSYLWLGCRLMKYWICSARNKCCDNTAKTSRRRQCRNAVSFFTAILYKTTFSDWCTYCCIDCFCLSSRQNLV